MWNLWDFLCAVGAVHTGYAAIKAVVGAIRCCQELRAQVALSNFKMQTGMQTTMSDYLRTHRNCWWMTDDWKYRQGRRAAARDIAAKFTAAGRDPWDLGNRNIPASVCAVRRFV